MNNSNTTPQVSPVREINMKYFTSYLNKNTSLKIALSVYVLIFLFSSIVTPSVVFAEDWPTYLHDNFRSASSSEQLTFPLLQNWAYSTERVPLPAWNETPALQDFGHGIYGNKSRVLYDRAFHVVVVRKSLYFGSSHSDKVVCLNINNGQQRWKFFAEGPIRFAPTVSGGKVYFGSDDGYVYCLNADSGSLLWRNRATSSNDFMFVNSRAASVSPVRTSVLIENGMAYWGAGLLSGAKTGLSRYLRARNANDGTGGWTVTPSKPHQGYLLSLNGKLYVPSGKSYPLLYNQSNGSVAGSYGGSRDGGCYALITEHNTFAFGPHYSSTGSYLNEYDSIGRVDGNFMIVKGDYTYYCTDTELVKLNRSNKQIVWSVTSPCRYSLIMAGNTLFAGGDDEVSAFSASNGQNLWTAETHGRAHGLAVANGYLFVSTDLGTIHAFKKNIYDLNNSGIVDLVDLMMFGQSWLDCTNPNDNNCVEYP